MTDRIKDIQTIITAPEGINLLVVKITTQQGLIGLGCATYAYRYKAVRTYIEEYLRPLMIGRDPEEISESWQLMHQNGYWRNGPIANSAISGIDMALWDIKGKRAGMPLYQLFGGKVRDGVPVYRHADGRDLSEVCDNIEKYRELGVRYIRCQCGGYGGDGYGEAPPDAARNRPGVYLDSAGYMRKTLKLFEGIRNKLGFSIELVHDVHERIAPSDAVTFAKEMEAFKLFFLEDIVSSENLEWLERIRSASTIPLAQGELFNHPKEFQPIVIHRLVDYLRCHLSQLGGITPAMKMGIFAQQFGVRLCWHGPGDMSPVAHAANIHLDMALSNVGIQEWSGIEPPNFVIQKLRKNQGALTDVFIGLPEFRNGYVYPNDKPGLGIELNEKEAEKYPCIDEVTLWTQTRQKDGSLQTP